MATFRTKDAGTIRDDILRTQRNGLVQRGVLNPQLGPGSNEYVIATAVANEIAVVNANVQIKSDAQMPDTATGSDLDRLAAQYGLKRRSAGPSVGLVTISTSISTFVPVTSVLVDSFGARYQVTVGATYTNTFPLNQIPIQALDTGTATNHPAGDVLRWTTLPAGSAPTAIVSVGGLNGGVDVEGDEDLRARLLSRMQNPPNNANWSQLAAIVEASSTAVQKAFVYPAANGPSTVHVAVTQAPQILSSGVLVLSSTSKNRDIDGLNGAATGAIMSGVVVPTTLGQMPEYVETVVTGVTNGVMDVSIALALPAAASAVPAGPGGGWVDGTPWPQSGGSFVSLTSVTSSTVFVVAATTAPSVNVSHICFLDPTTWSLNRAKVVAVTGSGPYTVTIDTPWPNLATVFGATGLAYIFPDAVNMQVYVNALLTAFGQMGPGEKVSSASANFTRAYRHPLPNNSWPYSMTSTQLRGITNTGSEVLDVSYLSRKSSNGTIFTEVGSAGPPVPLIATGPPSVYVPRNLAFYPL